MSKVCRYCKIRSASSKEHLIANKRYIRIKSFKDFGQRDDNVQKTYKGITCEDDNNTLGRYEEKSLIHLAHATIWKLLAGNINKVWKIKEYILRIPSEDTILKYEKILLKMIKEGRFYPEQTFTLAFIPLT